MQRCNYAIIQICGIPSSYAFWETIYTEHEIYEIHCHAPTDQKLTCYFGHRFCLGSLRKDMELLNCFEVWNNREIIEIQEVRLPGNWSVLM